MLSNLWFFDICTHILFTLGLVSNLLGNDNLLFEKMIVDKYIPILHRSKGVRDVDFGLKRHSENEVNKFHLVIKFIDKFNVLDIIVEERLIVFCIPITKSLIRVFVFTFPQLNKGDMVKTIRFLCRVSKLTIELKIVNLFNTKNIIHLVFTSITRIHHARVYNTPRGKTFHCVLTHDRFNTVADIGNIKELCIPTSDNVRVITFPPCKELCKKFTFSLTLDVLNIFSVIMIVVQTPNLDTSCVMVFDSD